MKKISSAFLVFLLLFTMACLSGCGGNKSSIVGTWQIVDEKMVTEYGIGMQFTEDGKLRYGLTKENLSEIAGKEVAEGLDALMSIEYKVKSNTEMEITISAIFGLAKESSTVTYELNGDTLTFDGTKYVRVK